MSNNNQKPNIILVNCDDLGYGDLGCYGSKLNSTPHLDKLADEGLRFTDFYMPSSVCSASRCGMLTGCYPARVGIDWVLFPGDSIGLNPDEITIARLLKDTGYRTKLVGKWHCGDQEEFLPNKHGFDEYFGIPYSNDMGMQAKKDGSRNANPPLPLMRGDEVKQEQPDQAGLTERYVDECLQFIEKPSSDPFFLYLAHMYVHTPLFVPQHFMEASKNGRYGAAVASIDWAMGVIMHSLKERGLDENTLVIFTSDNGSTGSGGGSNGLLRGSKGTCFEGGQRVPCIMRWPAAIKKQSTTDGIASAIDLYPTLANIAAAKIPTDRTIDGLDLSKVMSSGESSPREVFLYHSFGYLQAIRKGPWKLRFCHKKFQQFEGDVKELYNLDEDISEANNLYEQQPEIVAELTALAQEYRNELGDYATDTKGRGVRSAGKVDNPKTLTEYDEDHPYIVAMYDMFDRSGAEPIFRRD